MVISTSTFWSHVRPLQQELKKEKWVSSSPEWSCLHLQGNLSSVLYFFWKSSVFYDTSFSAFSLKLISLRWLCKCQNSFCLYREIESKARRQTLWTAKILLCFSTADIHLCFSTNVVPIVWLISKALNCQCIATVTKYNQATSNKSCYISTICILILLFGLFIFGDYIHRMILSYKGILFRAYAKV